MSTTDSRSLNSYDDELVQQLIERVDELERRVDEQEEEIEAKGARIEELEAKVESNANEIEVQQDELQDHREHVGKQTAELNQRVSEVEDEIDDLEATDGRASDSSTSEPKGEPDETTALERVCGLPEHVVEDNLTANQRRARSVARRIEEYGRKVPAGIAITSSRIKRILTAQEDTTIHRQTVSRVADFLERFGDGAVKIRETKGGKTTVVFDEEIVDAVTSVVTQEPSDGVTPATV